MFATKEALALLYEHVSLPHEALRQYRELAAYIQFAGREGPEDALAALRAEGYPIVIVRNWSEVSPAALERWWAELSPRERRACRTLGWSEGSWEGGDESPLEQAWEGLSRRQQTAATVLGYDAEDFEGDLARPMEPLNAPGLVAPAAPSRIGLAHK